MKPEWRAYLLRGVEATNHHRSAVDFRGVWAMDPKWSNLQIGTAKSVSVKVCGPLGAPVLILIHTDWHHIKNPVFFAKELPLSSKCKMFNLVIPCAQKSLNLAARICQVSKVWSLCPSMSYVLGGWTLAHEWMFWIMPASSSVTRKGQHPRRELYGHGNVLFRCSFQDTIDLYRSSDLHIVCIYIYIYMYIFNLWM